ncbi:MAG: methylmalonyl-CoA mutase family protein [Pseudomonadota bacterium]
MSNEVKNLMDAYFEKPKRTATWSGFPVREIYTPDDVAGLNYERDIADAGKYPYTRGIHSDMFRGRYWTKREVTGFGTPADTNRRLKRQIEEGVSGLNVIRDNPTNLGIDPDHPLAEGEVGLVGVNLCSLKDMEMLTEGIPLDEVSMSLICASCPAIVILSQYILVAERRGIGAAKLRGTIANDPLHCRYCGWRPSNPIDLSLKLSVDIIEYCTNNMPYWNTAVVNSYDLRENGVNATQEVAFGLAMAMAYIDGALERGLKVDDFASRRAFYCSSHIDFFEEIAKLRAARRMWARIMKERYGAENPNSWKFRFAVHTAGCSLVPQQPLNNIIRITYEALAAVLAGVQSLHSCSYDEPIALPTEESQRIALRTQQIIAYETGVSNVADPLGGSYYVENLTNRIEKEVTAILDEIEKIGGMVEAMRTGWLDGEIDRSSLEYQKEVERRERIIVGVNAFVTPPDKETPGGVHRNPVESEKEQIASVRELKAKRDEKRLRAAIGKLREKAQMGKEENLVSPIMEALKADGTLEEIMGTIRMVYGYSYDPLNVLESPF